MDATRLDTDAQAKTLRQQIKMLTFDLDTSWTLLERAKAQIIELKRQLTVARRAVGKRDAS